MLTPDLALQLHPLTRTGPAGLVDLKIRGTEVDGGPPVDPKIDHRWARNPEIEIGGPRNRGGTSGSYCR